MPIHPSDLPVVALHPALHRRGTSGLAVVVIGLLLLVCGWAEAAPKHLFKIATIAPEGSVWVKRFHEFADEVRSRSNGEIVFKIYSGGVMGDDRTMYRKMRIGQLNGGGFTVTGIGTVVPDFRVLAMPFLFRSYEEIDFVRRGLFPGFVKVFADKGMELLAMTEIGFVYTMSTEAAATLEDLKKRKSWVPEDDPVSTTFLDVMGITPTPLAIPDVLTALQTGMVDTVYNSLYGAIVLQWFTKAKFVTDIPYGYAYGAMLLDGKSFQRLSPEQAAMVKEAAKTHFERLIMDTRQGNEEALEVLKKNGVRLVAPEAGAIEALYRVRDQALERSKDEAFSAAILAETLRLVHEYRNGQ